LSSLCGNGVEEASCQACVQHSLQVREVVVVEEAGFQASEQLSQVREFVGKWFSPKESPAPAMEL
jgi:recombinational DNA repair protein RecR